MIDPEARRRTAHHEAAHAVVAELLGIRVDVVSIRPAEHHRGVTIHAAYGTDDEVTEIVARRHGKSLLARWCSVPYPLFDPDERRHAESRIMVSLAGRMGELLAPDPLTGYRDETADVDQERAIVAAVELTAEQGAWLDDAEQRVICPDEDTAFETAWWNTGKEAAGALVNYLTWETRRLMFSDLVRRLLPLVVDQLLTHEVISGETVREIVGSITGETLKHEEATTMVRAAAKQADADISRISEDTPVGRLWICTRAIIWSDAGKCAQGVIVVDTDPRVAAAPDAFRPLIEQLPHG